MSHAQHFLTADVLRLEIEDEPTGLVNMVQNPNGELGGYGWVTPVAGSALSNGYDTVKHNLKYTPAASVANHFYTEALPVTAGQYVAASWVPTGFGQAGYYYRAKIEWLDASQVLLSSATQTGYLNTLNATVPYGPHLAPASTAYARLRFDLYSNNTGANPTTTTAIFLFREVTVAKAATSAELGSLRTNLVTNPSFETNTTGWTIYVNTTLARVTTPAGSVGTACLSATRTTSAGHAAFYGTNPNRVAAVTGQTFAISADARAAATARNLNIGLAYFSSTGAFLGAVSSAAGFNTVGAWTRLSSTRTVDLTSYPSAAYVAAYFSFTNCAINEVHYLDAVLMEKTTTVGTYFDGATTDTATIDYAWTGTAHASTSTATSSNLAYIEPVPWLNILGPTHRISIDRAALDVGTLTATLLDATLDPSQDDLIRPGKRCRLVTIADGTPVFTGKVLHATVSYHLKDPSIPDQLRARVELTAVDNISQLASVGRASGVATIANLPYVLEGAGVPWNVNGSGNQVASATVVAYNDNASALDQIAITRDSVMGYAWVDRFNVLHAWDKALMPTGAGTAMSESVYTDLVVDYDTEACINEVMVTVLSYNAASKETTEVVWGPYRDAASVAEWGAHRADFTVQGSVVPATFAASVLAANATPTLRVQQLTLPIAETTDITTAKALIELYDRFTVTNTELGLNQVLLATTIRHEISPEKWLVTIGFSGDGNVAAPTVAPDISSGRTDTVYPVRRVATGTRTASTANTTSPFNIATATIPYPLNGMRYRITASTNITPDTAGMYTMVQIKHGVSAVTGGTQVGGVYADHRAVGRTVFVTLFTEFVYTGTSGLANYNVVLVADPAGGGALCTASASGPSIITVDEVA